MSGRLLAVYVSLTSIIGWCLFTSCKGGGGKKVASEALELIEKKGASKAASTIEQEVVQSERSVGRETEIRTTSRSRFRRRHHSNEEEDAYEPLMYPVSCPQCRGGGAVYTLDYYGNIQYDYYGNPLVGQCPYCNGTGSVLVSQ